jgi:hypothetical protein
MECESPKVTTAARGKSGRKVIANSCSLVFGVNHRGSSSGSSLRTMGQRLYPFSYRSYFNLLQFQIFSLGKRFFDNICWA